MDFLVSLENGNNAIMGLTTSRNNNVVGFYWDSENGEIDSRYIWRDESNAFVKKKDFSILEKAAFPLRVFEDSQGRLEVAFALKVSNDRKLYLVSNGGSQQYAIVFFDADNGLCQLKEIFVDFSSTNSGKVTSYCRCIRLNTKEEFTENVEVDMGPLQFLV